MSFDTFVKSSKLQTKWWKQTVLQFELFKLFLLSKSFQKPSSSWKEIVKNTMNSSKWRSWKCFNRFYCSSCFFRTQVNNNHLHWLSKCLKREKKDQNLIDWENLRTVLRWIKEKLAEDKNEFLSSWSSLVSIFFLYEILIFSLVKRKFYVTKFWILLVHFQMPKNKADECIQHALDETW